MHVCSTGLSALMAVTILGIVGPQPTHAEITGLAVTSAKDIGPFRGKPYREVEAQLQGTAPGGGYSVPVTLAFPKQASDHNGFAVVDVFNTVTVGDKKWFPGGRAFPVARFQIGEDFLFGTGHAYVGVNWDKKAVEALHNGTIATGTDGYTILGDTATLARNPSKYLPAEAGTAPASGRTIAYGYSQSSMVLRSWYMEHRNKQTGAPVFDGALVAGATGFCWDLSPTASSNASSRQKLGPKPCAGGLADGGKVIALATESDAQWSGGTERGDNPDYRTVEIAGVSHIPVGMGDFRPYGHPTQNPVSFQPVFRAALVNLEEWLNGKEPPPSVAIELSATPMNLECCGAVKEAVRDADGNAKGGVRLPHMTSALGDGRKAGAPLGHYTGFAYDFAKDNFYLAISGTFTPFPPEKIKALYPTHAAYVDAVKASAEDLVAKRYILPEDARAYVEAAEASDIGRP